MFPHVPLQAITLDLADTRSISQTVEHILNNAIYIPDNDGTAPQASLTPDTPTLPTPDTPTTSPEARSSREEPHPLHGNIEEETEREGEREKEDNSKVQSVLRRRRQVSSESIRDNRGRGFPHDGGGNQEVEEDVMSFSSLQRRKRELLANAKR